MSDHRLFSGSNIPEAASPLWSSVKTIANNSGGVWVLLAVTAVYGQDLAPRAYLITPVGANAVTLSYSLNNGGVSTDPSLPIEDGSGRFSTGVLSYYHSYGFLGRSSNIVVSVPYVKGNLQGILAGTPAQALFSGMADGRIRLSVNLRGGPAMRVKEFRNWRERRLIGASLTVVVPSGQYDPARLINISSNRWAFKPEIGFTRRWERWVAEGYFGVWLFSRNAAFYPGSSVRAQRPMAAVEAHLGYYVKRGLWASFDGNFWTGARSSINGTARQDTQRESRIGVTVSMPVAQHQSLKCSYSRGAYVRVGGDFQTLSVAWQYSWIGKPN